MSMSLAVLGSGSSGNCSLLAIGEGAQRRHLLIDIGFSPRQTNLRLASFGLCLDDIDAALITHFDADHFYPGWAKGMIRHQLPVYAHRRHRSRPLRRKISTSLLRFFDDQVPCEEVDNAQIGTMLFAHDELGTVGFVIEHNGQRLGYATDLGRVPEHLYDHFNDLDCLAFESNYDPRLQRISNRPWALKQRIMNGNGHLSNHQSLEAVQRIADCSPLQHVVLLHLSRQCNDPQLIQRLYQRQAPHLIETLTLTSQREPSPLLQLQQRSSEIPIRRSPHAIGGGMNTQLALF